LLRRRSSFDRTGRAPAVHPGHFLNPGVHHRGQATTTTTMLMQLGVDPGVTDLIAMLRAEKT
jgi:uncharacterized damage-inducible protein DinB